ncbi:MAG TPA: RNA-binding S4 domain-containing protein [Acidimicrobiales bacterium]|nr:RNA-binding S4 domain-containing protein [Acidimicrobiales bacterium]
MDSVRVDRWLWSMRAFRTRTAATEACRAGHVRVNEIRAKPSTEVRPGDRVCIRLGSRQRELEVVETLGTRRSATEAATAFIDRSPAPPLRKDDGLGIARDAATGRPTKRDRRRIDRLRGR